MVTKDLGMVTAYAYAVAGGYTGTEEEFTQLMASLADEVSRIENLSVTVTTLPAGSQATASLNGSVLSLGIPKGDKGDKGNTGNTPDFGIGTVTTLSAGSSATASIAGTAEAPVLNLGIPEGQAGSGAVGTVASAYSSSSTYAVGDYVIHNSNLYRCTTAITTAEAFTAAHWTQVVLGDDVSDLKSGISEVTNEEPPINLIDPTTIVDNSLWQYQNPESGNYSRTGLIKVKPNTVYTFGNTDYMYWDITDVRARFVVYFDADGTRISKVEDITTFTTPNSCEYVAVTFKKNARNVVLLEGSYNATTQTMVYVPYVGDKRVLDGATIVNLSTAHIDDYAVVGKNLFDPSAITPNSFLEKYPQISANNASFVSDYIKVSAGEDYVISNDFIRGTDYSCRSYVLYDEQYQKVSAGKGDTKNKVITPSVNGYLRFTGYTDQLYRTQVEIGDTQTAFEPFKRTLNSTALLNDEQIAQVDNILFKKKWVVCGDSFTAGGEENGRFVDGKFAQRVKTYPYIIGTRNDMDIVRFFEGGRTLAFPAEPGTFTNSITNPTRDYYYQNIPADADYITFYLGINDEHHATGGGDGEDPTGEIPLGTIGDNTVNTYYGAWNVVLSWLITNRPNAHIGIIVTNGLSLESYRTAQIEIARKYGIPFIDMNGDDRTPAMLRTVNPNIATSVKQALITKWAVDPTGTITGTVNTHPNTDAHEYESTYIENFLRSI